LREVHRVDGVLDPLADDVELALEVHRVAHVTAPDEDLLDARLDVDGARAEQPIVLRHLAPAEQALPLLGHDRGDEAADLLALHGVARQEHAADAVIFGSRQRNAEAAALLAEELVGHLQEDPGAIARVGLASTRAAVQEVDEDEQTLADDRVRLASFDVDHEADAARIVLVRGVVQPLRFTHRPTPLSTVARYYRSNQY